MPRTKRLNQGMTRFLQNSGYGDPNEVVVLTDGARDLAGVANDLPYDNERIKNCRLAGPCKAGYCSSAALEIDDFTSRPPALTANITALPSSERCG
jgi:hypothetical protein